MTAGSLPEGLVERCAEAGWDDSRGRHNRARLPFSDALPEVRDDWLLIVRAVLAVAAPAIREAALRDRAELEQLVRDTRRPCVSAGSGRAIPKDSCSHCVATAELQRRVGA